jgi:XTP/dITP diphosphohydrolase
MTEVYKLTFLLATRNQGKAREFRRIVQRITPGYHWHILTADQVGLGEVAETGKTFAENAALKAIAASKHSPLISVGEDSGLEVDALGGLPGIQSHRFSPTGDDEDNNDMLLSRMVNVPESDRTARYRCAIAVAHRGKVVLSADGVVEGLIIHERRGQGGFGYDPLFYCPELGKTMAEADGLEKDRVSHRKRAIEQIIAGLVELILTMKDA